MDELREDIKPLHDAFCSLQRVYLKTPTYYHNPGAPRLNSSKMVTIGDAMFVYQWQKCEAGISVFHALELYSREKWAPSKCDNN